MGKSITPTYRVETTESSEYPVHPNSSNCFSWHCSGVYGNNGKPTPANLTKWVSAYNYSYLSGGVNEHIAQRINRIPVIHKARIVHQRTGQIMAEYKAPMFQAI